MPKRQTRSTAKRFTKAVRETILKSLRIGNFRETACRRARVTDRTFRRWIARGEQELQDRDEALRRIEEGERIKLPEITEYGEFALEVARVETEAEQQCLGVVLSGEADDIRWFLERRYPKRWGKGATRVEVSGPDGGAVKVEDARKGLFDRLAEAIDREGSKVGPSKSDPQPAE